MSSNAFRPGALYKGEEIVKDIAAILNEFKPTKIFLSHPADHNGDHRSLYLFTRVAIWELNSRQEPQLYPYLVYYRQGPLPRGFHPEEKIRSPEAYKEQIPWEVDLLSNGEIKLKEEALRKHRSQYESSAAYLDSFVRGNELFGDFPLVAPAVNAPSVSLSANRRDGPDNDPSEVALGVAIGVFIAILPLYGLHTILVLTAAFFIRRANVIAMLVGTNISLPPTVPFITWAGYNIGRLMLGNKYAYMPSWTFI